MILSSIIFIPLTKISGDRSLCMDCMQISKQAMAILSLICGNDMYVRSNVEVAIVVQIGCNNNSFQKLSVWNNISIYNELT